MFNVIEFLDSYTSNLIKSNKNANILLNDFAIQENNLREYEDLLSRLELVKNEATLDGFSSQLKIILNNLLEFDPDDSSVNSDNINAAIKYIESISGPTKLFSEKRVIVERLWVSFIESTNASLSNSKLTEEINKDFHELELELSKSNVRSLEYSDRSLAALKQKIELVASSILILEDMLFNNIFTGDKEILFFEELSTFYRDTIVNFSRVDILEKIEYFKNKIKGFEEDCITEDLKLKLLVGMNESESAVIYALKLKEVIIKLSPMNIEDVKYEDLGSYIYVSGFPVKGVLSKKSFNKNFIISKKQIDSNILVKKMTSLSFFVLSFFIFIASLLALFKESDSLEIVVEVLVIVSVLVFPFLITFLEKIINKKMLVEDSAFLKYIDLKVFTKGLPLFPTKRVIPSIYENLEDILDIKAISKKGL